MSYRDQPRSCKNISSFRTSKKRSTSEKYLWKKRASFAEYVFCVKSRDFSPILFLFFSFFWYNLERCWNQTSRGPVWYSQRFIEITKWLQWKPSSFRKIHFLSHWREIVDMSLLFIERGDLMVHDRVIKNFAAADKCFPGRESFR